MPYKRSVYRLDFDNRIKLLKVEAVKANRLPDTHRDIRDMVFQCAIFQTSAALESYLKLIVESWFQEIKNRSLGALIPNNTRGHFALRQFSGVFERYLANRDEAIVASTLGGERAFWPVMTGAATVPSFIKGADVHDGVAYPSYKNLQKLFARLGLPKVQNHIAAILRRDVETMIEGFQSIRTALAHAAPPAITLYDVRSRLADMADLVRAIDRILYVHIHSHGGAECWK